MATAHPKRGRPAIAGSYTTITLTPAASDLVQQGAELLGTWTAKSPSKAAWLRHLIAELATLTPTSLMTSDELHDRWPSSAPVTPARPITVLIDEPHRIWLRQWECFVQSLDWTLPLYRNETVSILIEAQGPLINTVLRNKIRAQKKAD